jgi:L-lysine exporter family protein LysE/ArgO
MPFSNGFLLSLSLCLDIGVANIAMITLAMQRGFLQGFWLGLGTCVGDLIYAVAALAGMTVLLQFGSVRWSLWLGGSVLLVWFAVKMLLAAWRGGHLEGVGRWWWSRAGASSCAGSSWPCPRPVRSSGSPRWAGC